MNWKKEGEFINTYADYEVKETKKGILDYIEFILSVNGGEEYLFENEKQILKVIK